MSKGNLLLRNDTFFGVCEGLGQDFGFHPNWLRITFAAGFYFNPMLVISIYLGLGMVVAASRFAFPERSSNIRGAQRPEIEEVRVEQEQLPLAA